MPRIHRLLMVSFVVVMVMLMPVLAARAQEGTPTAATDGAAMAAPAVVVSNQAFQDNRVVVDSARSDGPGWMAIHAANADGAVGPVIGHSALTNGDNAHVVVAIDDASAVTQNLFAMLHVDAGQIGLYEFPGADAPAQADGKILNFPFSITGDLPGAMMETPGAMVETPAAMMETPAAMMEAPAAAGAPVQVQLSEFTIQMPTTLPAGPTVLEVSNTGARQHNIVIEGQGIEVELDTNLQSGQSGTLEVNLVPGEYVVYCPVGNHRGQGMELTLNVTG